MVVAWSAERVHTVRNAKKKSWKDFTRQMTLLYFLTVLDVSDKMRSDQISNSSSEQAITSFHLVSCFMHLSSTVSHSFISVINSISVSHPSLPQRRGSLKETGQCHMTMTNTHAGSI